MSTVHSVSVFAFKNKAKTNFVNGESSYLARYDNAVVSESWTSVVFWPVDFLARSWDNFNALRVSSQRLTSWSCPALVGSAALDQGNKRSGLWG